MMRPIRQLGQPCWQIFQFYWQHADAKQKRIAWMGLLSLVALSVLVGAVLVYESVQRGEFISALAAQDAQRSRIAASRFVVVLLLAASLLSLSAYLRDRLGLKWRKDLTYQLTGIYLDKRHYYFLPEAVDNPDQRIEADVRNLTQLMLTVLTIFIESIVQLFGFVGVLLSISYGLTGFLLVYALLGSAIAILFFGRKLTWINAEQIKREANFRFNLTEVGDHAEAIALHRGQRSAKTRADEQFKRVVDNFNRFIRWQLGLDCFQNSYQYLTFILPSLILAPAILNGPLEIGAIVQSQAAFDRIWLSLSLVVVQFEQLTALAASTGRLQQLLDVIHQIDQPHISNIHRVQRDSLEVKNLTLHLPPVALPDTLPNSRQSEKIECLFEDLSFLLDEPLLITGPSGIGKSSLIKAIAALWQNGEGTIISPGTSQSVSSNTQLNGHPQRENLSILFLPQQPYMTLGSLREQLLYPVRSSPAQSSLAQVDSLQKSSTSHNVSDDRLRQVLGQVQLAHLSDLDQVADWAGQLSVGEQQRLAFARLLVHQPAFAILDEATSAVSLTQENILYQQLAETHTVFVSVGHRSSLRPHHSKLLTLSHQRTWTISPL